MWVAKELEGAISNGVCLRAYFVRRKRINILSHPSVYIDKNMFTLFSKNSYDNLDYVDKRWTFITVSFLKITLGCLSSSILSSSQLILTHWECSYKYQISVELQRLTLSIYLFIYLIILYLTLTIQLKTLFKNYLAIENC